MTARISIAALSKTYRGSRAVSDLSFEVQGGSVCGLLGPNGAGKTTTFKCMLGLARADAGTVLFDGAPIAPAAFERLVYVPETPALYPWMSGTDHLRAARGSYRAFDERRAAELVELFALDPRKRIRAMSKGQKTALALVIAFAVRPEILILDEPASGLDPLHQRSVLNLIIDAAADGASVLFSSHQIGQVERAADCVAILKQGKLVRSGPVDDLKAQEKIVEATFDGVLPQLTSIGADPSVQHVMAAGRMVRLTVRGDGSAVAARLEALGPSNVRVLDQNLEDIFLNAVDAAPLGVAAEGSEVA